MIVIHVKENESIDRALKRFKKKFEKTKVLRQIRSRAQFEKPSVVKRNAKIKSAYKQSMMAKEKE